jgi:O-antigen ligase
LNLHRLQISDVPRILLIGYAVVLTLKGTAALQAGLLIGAFVFLIFENRESLKARGRESLWLIVPAIPLSAWVFATCFTWPSVPGAFDQPADSLDLWRRDIAQPMLALVCGFMAFREEKWRNRLFTALCLLILVLLVKSLLQFYLGELSFDRENNRYFHNKGTFSVRGFSRDNIFFSYILLLLTPGAIYLAFAGANRRSRLLGIAATIALCFLIFLNKRRGTWLAFLAEILILLAWMDRRILWTFLISMLLAAFAAYQFRPHWFIRDYDERLVSTHTSSRIQIMKDLPPLLAKRPLTGVGFGKEAVIKNYWQSIYQHAHNTFFNKALEVGFPGLGLWIAMIGMYGYRLWITGRGRLASQLAFALLIAFCVRNFFDDIWLSSIAELFWFTLGVLHPVRRES